MPFGLDPKSVAIGVVIGAFVLPMVTAQITARRAK